MKIAIIGAIRHVGTRLIDEMLRRDHQVTVIAHITSKLPTRAGPTTRDVNIADEAGLVAALAGNDIVYNTVRFLQASTDQTVGAVKKAVVPRLLMVGGVGNLEVVPGVVLIDTPQFLKEYFEETLAGCDFLNALRKETELNWMLVPSLAILEPGECTGCSRIGKDSPLADANGKPRIPMEDYAIVFLDEMEKSAHLRQRFTVGY